MALETLEGTPYEKCRILNTYVEVDEALRSNNGQPRFRPMAYPFEGDTVLKLHGEPHKIRRKLENALVHPTALAAYERDIMLPAIETTLAETAAHRSPDGLVRADLVALSRRLVMQVTAAVIGLDGVEDADGAADIFEILASSIEGIKIEWYTGDKDAAVARGIANKQRFWDNYIEPSMARRRKILAAQGKEAMPIDLLSLIVQQEGTPAQWDDDLIRRECIVWLVGVGATTPTMATHTVVDVTKWLESNPDGRARFADSDFMHRLVNESIRLHPPAVALLRDYPEGCPGRSITIDPGEEMFLDVETANRDTSVFGADAGVFNPDRHLPVGVPAYGLSFGQGKHICLGLPVAVGGKGAGTEGIAVLLIRALLDAGVRLDPDDPPRRPATIDDRYEALPVIFDGL